MPTSFLTGLSTEVKPYFAGEVDGKNTRYGLVNSRNYNRKIMRLGNTVTTQKLGIDAPTVAPTGAGTGANLYYCYVYVNKKFQDPLAAEATDYYIRSNTSPVLTAASSAGAPTVTMTASTDAQVTHLWLYVGNSADGPFVRLTTGYEVANTGTPSLTGVTTVPTTGYLIESDNYPLETCQIFEVSNGFGMAAGFVPITGTASATVGSPTVTITTGTTFPDGIINLYFQFLDDTTGGLDGDGIHICKYATSGTITLIDAAGANRNYDGGTNKTDASFRIYRPSNVLEFTKRYNIDFTPAPGDPDFLVRGPGPIKGVAVPTTGYAVRVHYNSDNRKSVDILDITQGLPPKRYQTASAYAMSNPRAWANAGGRMFYYDKDAGVIEDRGLSHLPVTLNVIPNLIRSLSKDSADIAEMVYDESRNLMFLSVAPSGYTKGYYLIVYNLTTDVWSLWFMLPNVLSMRRIKQTDGTVVVKMGSSDGSITVWPSAGFNEAVGASIVTQVGSVDDLTHLTSIATPFPATGDKLTDRWIMTWNDQDDVPVYQFARISTNTTSRLTLDTFIGPTSSTGFSPTPSIGDAVWCGPIQSILGPNWDYNSLPDDDGHLLDFSMVTSGLDPQATSRVELFKNFETTSTVGGPMIHSLYQGGTNDPDHQSLKLGLTKSIECTGVTGWRVVDNNEYGLSIKSIIRRVRQVSEDLNQQKKTKAKTQ